MKDLFLISLLDLYRFKLYKLFYYENKIDQIGQINFIKYNLIKNFA